MCDVNGLYSRLPGLWSLVLSVIESCSLLSILVASPIKGEVGGGDAIQSHTVTPNVLPSLFKKGLLLLCLTKCIVCAHVCAGAHASQGCRISLELELGGCELPNMSARA